MALKNGKGNITGWQAHRACMGKGKLSDCINSTFTPELYEDDFTAVNAIELLKRSPANKPWFLHVSFPGPHDPFLVTADMRNAASDGRVWPEGVDNPKNNTPGGACATVVDPSGTRNRCNCESDMNETAGAAGGGRGWGSGGCIEGTGSGGSGWCEGQRGRWGRLGGGRRCRQRHRLSFPPHR